ncbi:MAG: hypothetical protein JKY55_12870 [Aliivibrio sp.]|uniref:hypothetical protein n=1 Tax=Aliivibrio sp. TaxID=1872443 RepID=UPI001A43B980|nr:hypothetical protein [Aliivibrio sp.]
MSDLKHVIDCNVAIVANGKSTQASIDCEISCVELLAQCRDIAIVIDAQGLIMDEYSGHLSYAGSPGVGDMFFKYLHDNQYAESGIFRVEITPTTDENRSFEELPVNQFDPSDRKFLATAVVGNSDIFNATDSDWGEQEELMNHLGVTVHQLCPECSVK